MLKTIQNLRLKFNIQISQSRNKKSKRVFKKSNLKIKQMKLIKMSKH
jgi:hypothetical protein